MQILIFIKFTIIIDETEQNIDTILEEIFEDNEPWAQLENLWRASRIYRTKDISNSTSTISILNKWKHYKQPLGHKLVKP